MRLLIVAGEDLAEAGALPASITRLVEASEEILVMSPSFVSRLQWLTGEVDRARLLADDRVATIVGRLAAKGVAATGARGDELPMTAFADAIAQFTPDHILIGLRVPHSGDWQRHKLVDDLLDRFGIPITVFGVQPS